MVKWSLGGGGGSEVRGQSGIGFRFGCKAVVEVNKLRPADWLVGAGFPRAENARTGKNTLDGRACGALTESSTRGAMFSMSSEFILGVLA